MNIRTAVLFLFFHLQFIFFQVKHKGAAVNMSQRGGLKTSVEVCVHTPVCVCRYVTKKHWLRAGRVKLPKRRKSIGILFHGVSVRLAFSRHVAMK